MSLAVTAMPSPSTVDVTQLLLAWGQGDEMEVLLGHVIAHEIGHLLLPPNSHSLKGLMAGHMDQRQALRATKGALWFSAKEAETIRAGLTARNSR